MPRWIRTRDLNRRAATETYIVFCLVWQPRWVRVSSGRVISPITDRHPCLGRIRTHDLSGRAAALTDIIFYLAWQPPVCQDLLIHTRLLWTSDQSANRLTSIPRWNSNPRSQPESGHSDRHCILFGVTAPVSQGLLSHTQRLIWTSDQPDNGRTSMPRWNSNPRYQASGRCNRYCILFGVTAPGGSGLPRLHTSTPLDDSPITTDIHASVEFEPVISTSERPLWWTLYFIWRDSPCGSRLPQVRVSSGWVISPIIDRHPCFGGIRTHDLSRRAATLTDIEFYLVWQPPLGQGFLIHTRLLCMSDQSDNRQTSTPPSQWDSNPTDADSFE